MIKRKSKPTTRSERSKSAKKKPLSEKTKPVWHLKVVSSNIAKAAFNFKKQKLMIKFKNGSQYVYDDVNMYEWLAFSEADSQGKWFMENIKDIKPFKQLE